MLMKDVAQRGTAWAWGQAFPLTLGVKYPKPSLLNAMAVVFVM